MTLTIGLIFVGFIVLGVTWRLLRRTGTWRERLLSRSDQALLCWFAAAGVLTAISVYETARLYRLRPIAAHDTVRQLLEEPLSSLSLEVKGPKGRNPLASGPDVPNVVRLSAYSASGSLFVSDIPGSRFTLHETSSADGSRYQLAWSAVLAGVAEGKETANRLRTTADVNQAETIVLSFVDGAGQPAVPQQVKVAFNGHASLTLRLKRA